MDEDQSSSSSRSNGKAHAVQPEPEQHHLPQQHASSQLSPANDLQQQLTPSSSNSSQVTAKQADASAATPEAAGQGAAAAADAAFMQLLLLLAQRAAFVPLSERDVALSVSLNTDFLWQLFVKVSTEQLDATLVPPQLLTSTAGSAVAAAAGGGAGSAAGQLKETDSLLVLRCVSSLACRKRTCSMLITAAVCCLCYVLSTVSNW
jgi:hypothetical protein